MIWFIVILFAIVVVQSILIFKLKVDVESAHRNIGMIVRASRKMNKDFE